MSSKKQCFNLNIQNFWNGEKATVSEKTALTVSITPRELHVQFEAPFHDDPAPPSPKGECDGLWNYEIVELFLLGTAGHYLEVEIGPHGHYLIFHLSGIRQVTERLTPLRCSAEISKHSWRGSITVDLKTLAITPWQSVNAYAIHGQGIERRYLAAFPVPGETPDFHQPLHFESLEKLCRE